MVTAMMGLFAMNVEDLHADDAAAIGVYEA
jgi:hypothetical protein